MIYTGVGKAGTYRECAVLNYGLFYEFHAWDRLGCTVHRPAPRAKDNVATHSKTARHTQQHDAQLLCGSAASKCYFELILPLL